MTVKAEATELFSWGTEGEITMGENESTPVAQAVATSPPEAVKPAVVPEAAPPTADAATAEPGPATVDSAAATQTAEQDLPTVVKVEKQADGEFAVVGNLGGPVNTRSAAELDHEETVKRLAVDFAMAGLAAAKAKSAAKEAAEKQDAALTLLQGAITDGPEEMPLFDREPADGPEAACSASPIATEGALEADATSVAVTSPSSPASPAADQASYDVLLRSAKLADLTLTRDGKKVSLKGTVDKLDGAGVRTIYDWERLRAAVSTNQPGAEYPLRIRRDDLEEAVAVWIQKNSLAGLKAAKQPIPAPSVAQDAPQSPKADKQTVEPEKPVDAKPEAKAAAVAPAAPAVEAPKTAAEILESQSLLVLAMPRDVVLALEADGITTLAKLQSTVDANTFSAKFKPADRSRIAGRLAKWIAETLPMMLP